MADKDKAKIDLGLLEEDDEFEEFPAEGKRIIAKRNSSRDFSTPLSYFRLGRH